MTIKVAPSILSADYINLQKDIELIESAGAEFVHIDVMDGMFVPSSERPRPCQLLGAKP